MIIEVEDLVADQDLALFGVFHLWEAVQKGNVRDGVGKLEVH